MSIAFRSLGIVGAGTTTATPGVPAGMATGDGVLIFLTTKANVGTTSSVATPAGWTKVSDVFGGGGTEGNNVGPTRGVWLFREKDAGWSTMPTIAVTNGGSTACMAFAYSKGSGAWAVAAAAGTFGSAAVTQDGTTLLTTDPGLTAADLAVVGYSNGTTALTYSAHAVTAPGISAWGTATERSLVSTGTGNNAGGTVFDVPATTGTSSGAPTTIVSMSTPASRGTASLVRLRETGGASPTTINGGQATESDAALAGTLTVGQRITGGQATEVATALAGVILAGATLTGGQAAETDTALAGTVTQGQVVAAGQAVETDTALPGVVTSGAVIVGGQAQESDTALAGSIADSNVALGGQAFETDTALPGTIVLGYGATDTTNRVGGLSLGGYAVATWEPPVAAAPATIVHGHAAHFALAFGPVTMNGTQPEYDVDRVEKTRLRDRIIVGGVDITYFRDKPTPLPAYQLVSPLLYGPATLRIPQIAAAFEQLGVGALKWLKRDKTVLVQRVDVETGEVIATDYKGLIVAFNTSGRDLSVEIGGEASGRAALMERQTPIFRFTNDLGVYAYRAIRGLGLPFEPYLGPDTGIKLARFGGTGYLDYISQLCARAWTRAGNQWTIMPINGVYRMFRKDTDTIDGTAYLDDSMTVGDLRRDGAEEPNRIYVTGITPEGQRVRFGSYPGLQKSHPAPYPFNDNRNFGIGTTDAETDTGDGIAVMVSKLRVQKYMDAPDAPGGYDADAAEGIRQLQDDANLPVTGTMTPATWRALYDLDATGFSLRQSAIQPAAQKTYTRQWNRSGSGAIMGRNPDYDPRRLKVDRNIDMGSGFTIAQMREFARAERDVAEDNWVGTITFHTGGLVNGDHTPGDPVTDNMVKRARALRPGMNLSLPLFQGGIVVHVSAVSVDEDGKVTATVDTRARDSMHVWEVLARNRESRANPARQWVQQHRASGTLHDAIDGWDEVGGLLGSKVTVPGHKWEVFEVVAGQEGTVARLLTETNPDAEYVVAVFGRKIPGVRLGRLVGNPLTKRGARKWADEGVRNQLDRSHLMLYVAGDSEQPCGYFPRNKRPETVITDETNPDYAPGADPDHVGTDDEPTIEVETETGSITPLTGKWKDDAGFGYRTFAQPVVYVAVYADRDTSIPAGRIMWPQLEAGA